MKSFTVSISRIRTFRRRVLAWYRANGRSLPWRRTHDPYKILVSEMMLQQTQVDRVKDRYRQWLRRFPTVQALAKANRTEVLQAWSGLGYNRRALALHDIARRITQEYNGQFPRTMAELTQFKGIGQYTASAIMAFAFRQPVPIVDTNIKRVLGRVFLGFRILAQLRDTDDPFWLLKEKIVPRGRTAYDFNQGLMDFGAMVCTAKQPRCHTCPMRTLCKSYPDILHASADQLRVKTKRAETLYYGQPRRIWRGKILAYIQALPTKQQSASPPAIGKHIQSDWNDSRIDWLCDILEIMEKDGLIRIRRIASKTPKPQKNWTVRLG